MGLSGGLATNGGAAGGTPAATARQVARNQAIGFTDQTCGALTEVNHAAALPSNQQVSGTLAGLVAGDVVTNVFMDLHVAAAGTGPTGAFCGLYSAAGSLLASTANLASNALWTTATGLVSAPLSAPFTVVTTAGYYFVLLINGTWSVTQPTIGFGLVSSNGQQKAGPGGASVTVFQNGQTTLPSSATWARGQQDAFWFGWS